MNPEHLATFLAVCEHMNFTRAAEARFLSQPAVSRHVQALNAELGVRLFEQVGRTLQLTDAGRTLAPLAAELLGNMERVAEAVQRHRDAAVGRLRIGASSTPGLYLLPPALGRFQRAYPGVEVHYRVESSRATEQQLLRNEIDLAFVGQRPASRDLEARRFADDTILCVCGTAHPLAARGRLDPPSLADELWVVRRRGSATRELFERWLAGVGVRFGRVIELESNEAIKRMVEAGIGLSAMSSLAVATERERGDLVVLPVEGLSLERPLYVVRHVRKHPTPVMDAFLEHLPAGP